MRALAFARVGCPGMVGEGVRRFSVLAFLRFCVSHGA